MVCITYVCVWVFFEPQHKTINEWKYAFIMNFIIVNVFYKIQPVAIDRIAFT